MAVRRSGVFSPGYFNVSSELNPPGMNMKVMAVMVQSCIPVSGELTRINFLFRYFAMAVY